MENILPRREARENAFLLAFSQTFGDIPLAEALSNHAENDEEHPVDAFSRLLLNAYYDHSDERKPGVVINEAVELTKKYGAGEDYQFVNGLLGAVARDHGLSDEAVAESAEQ